MSAPERIVFTVDDVPLLEAADGTMRNSIMITPDHCGAQMVSGGLST